MRLVALFENLKPSNGTTFHKQALHIVTTALWGVGREGNKWFIFCIFIFPPHSQTFRSRSIKLVASLMSDCTTRGLFLADLLAAVHANNKSNNGVEGKGREAKSLIAVHPHTRIPFLL